MTRAAIIARVSTEKQAGAQRHSLSTQEENGRDVAERQGWDVVRVFTIPGESAYVDDFAKRPEFLAAIEFAERGGCDVILFSEMSRFARSPIVGWTAIHRMRQAGVRLLDFSLTDYTADEDKATFDIWAARRSSRDHAHRVAAGIDKQFRRGLPTGDIPFGYRRQLFTDSRGVTGPDTNSPPAIVPEEADAVRWCFHAYLSGVGYLAMAEELNRRGLKPRSKSRRAGGIVLPAKEEFTITGIQRWLTNPFYAGWLTHRGERVRGQHEPIVSEELFAEVQSRAQSPHRRRRARSMQLLSGIVVCSLCARPITCQKSQEHYYYRERPRGGTPCVNDRRGMRADLAHQMVESVISAIEPENDAAFLRYVHGQVRQRPSARAAQSRDALEEERKAVLDCFFKRQISVEEKDAALDDIARRLVDVVPEIDSVDFALHRMRRFSEVWEMASEERRGEAVRILLRSVRMDVKGHELQLEPWPDYEPLFHWRREYVAGVRPGGLARRTATSSLYLPAELVGVAS